MGSPPLFNIGLPYSPPSLIVPATVTSHPITSPITLPVTSSIITSQTQRQTINKTQQQQPTVGLANESNNRKRKPSIFHDIDALAGNKAYVVEETESKPVILPALKPVQSTHPETLTISTRTQHRESYPVSNISSQYYPQPHHHHHHHNIFSIKKEEPHIDSTFKSPRPPSQCSSSCSSPRSPLVSPAFPQQPATQSAPFGIRYPEQRVPPMPSPALSTPQVRCVISVRLALSF